jgi:hypothetical protein
MSDAFGVQEKTLGVQEATLGVQEERLLGNQNKTFVLLESATGLRHSRGPLDWTLRQLARACFTLSRRSRAVKGFWR